MAEQLKDVVLRFQGGLADGGRMHLYEYSRAQYGFARILTTIEQYRRSGKIIEKVSKNQKIDLIVSVPKKGSFELDIKVAVRDAAETYLETVPFELLFSLVLDRLIPRNEEHEKLIQELAKIQIAERPADLEWLGVLRSIAEGEQAASGQALRIVNAALNSSNAAVGRAGITYDQLRRAQLLLESDYQRQITIVDEEKFLKGIDSAEIDKLVARVRPMFNEVAVPFASSATELTIGNDISSDAYYRLDPDRLEHIQSRILDETEVTLNVWIKSYDRETGTGRMRSDEFSGVKSFQVDPSVREEVQPEIIRAMNKRNIDVTFVRYTDKNGVVTSYMARSVG